MSNAKSVLITGGSSGIGAACVELFAAQGCDVCSLDVAMPRVGANASHITCDITDFSAIESVTAQLSAIDVVVCCAGISLIKPFATTTPDEWDKILATNITGTYNCIRAALPHLLEKKCGSIVLVSSIWGVVGASCEVAYSTSKAALIGMTKSLAKELAPSNITVNCVAPGVIDTPMNLSLDESTTAELISEIPLSRLGTAKEVAQAIHFLTTARYITGQVLTIDGGLTI